jgi:hypothetical protein
MWHQAGGLNPVSKLVFVKIENNNLLCVVLLIKTIVCDMHIKFLKLHFILCQNVYQEYWNLSDKLTIPL